jgi:thiol-disulfide isomerase/thioredoxin
MRQSFLLFTSSLVLGACAPPPDLGGGATDDAADAAGDDATDDGVDGGTAGGPAGVSLDAARLDRSGEGGRCGFPSAGPEGYGANVGQRLANSAAFQLIDCEGNVVQLADYFCEREGGGYNAGVLINIGAGWCAPCQEETREFPELYEEFHDQGIEFVQVLFQDWNAQAPTKTFCSDWSTGQWSGADGAQDVGLDLQFPVLLDQVNDWTAIYLQDPQSATPVNMLLDANGNIRWKIEGQKPDPAVLRAQFGLVLADPYGD